MTKHHQHKWRNFLPALIAVVAFTLLSYFISFQVQINRGGELSSSVTTAVTTTISTTTTTLRDDSNDENDVVATIGQPSIDPDWNRTLIFGSDANFTIIGVVFDSKQGSAFINSFPNSTFVVCRRGSSGISAISCVESTRFDIIDESATHLYFNYQNGTSFLIARLAPISSLHYFCYGLPSNNATVTNACPPCICSALFQIADLRSTGDAISSNRLFKNARFSPCLKMKQNASGAVRRPSDVFLVGDSPSLGAPQAWAVRELFERSKMPLVLEGGTLLGWYRNCSVVWTDVDVDFSVPSFALNNAFYKSLVKQAYVDKQALKMTAFHAASNSTLNLKSARIFGDVDYGVEVRFDVRKSNDLSSPIVGIDVFVLYLQQPGINYSYVQGFVTWERTIMQYALPRDLTLCSTIFFGDLFLVPCEPEPYLLSHYGEGWRYPKGREDGYWRSQPNIVKRIRLSAYEWNQRIMFKSFESEPW